MQIEQQRSQFSIYIFSNPQRVGPGLKNHFEEIGYDSTYASSLQVLLSYIDDKTPHLVILDLESVGEGLTTFVSAILEKSSEILISIVATAEDFNALQSFRDFGLSNVLVEGESFYERAAWLVDKDCEALYYRYQNEEIFTQLQDFKKQNEKIQIENENLISKVNEQDEIFRFIAEEKKEKESQNTPKIISQLSQYSIADSKDAILQSFMNFAGEGEPSLKGIYFKFLSTAQTLLATHSLGLPVESIQGLGVKMEVAEFSKFEECVWKGEIPQSLKLILKEVFYVGDVEIKILKGLNNLIDGIFVYWPPVDSFQIAESWAILSLYYRNYNLEKRMSKIEIYDTETELNNRNFYFESLQAEVVRARRIEKPVSVVRLRLDQFQNIKKSLGENRFKLVMNYLATILQKTSRVNDFSCRLNESDIGLILPHCSRKGAAIRAERLRRTFEQLIQAQMGGLISMPVTMSAGVSEYPSLSSSAQTLDESALAALNHIIEKSGNKVCLYKATHEFKPDFHVAII
jgi:diguanylate cyclase (GGDEF)-like protein